jgi:3-oxoadipate enol-lactonase/4-carboxymuconolactone decarboxylase
MPLLAIRDTTCYCRFEGRDDRPVLMLSHSLGQDHGMWDAQAADLAPHFRILRYDIRGHGASGVTRGDYQVAQLAADALALADALGVERFAFCGLSLGGMIGMWIATHAPERLTALVLANTSARPDGPAMEARRKTVLSSGMDAVADTAMGRFFSPKILSAHSPAVETARRTLVATSPVGYAGCCAALRDMNMTADLPRIAVPVLVICGDLDIPMPWKGHSDVLATGIPHARVTHLHAAHLSNIETPRSFSSALMDFLVPPAPDAVDGGLAIRRAVLGDAHVDRAIAATTPFTDDFQELITRYAWGTIWSRPGLDVRTRRLLALAITAALGRWDEFRLHVAAGLPRELELCDLEEVLLQTAVYAGVPAANTGFKIASEIGTPARVDEK